MNKIRVQTKNVRCPVRKTLRIVFLDINRASDGCLYPEMCENRSFEDIIPPRVRIDEDIRFT
jgi:hypothetical protein